MNKMLAVLLVFALVIASSSACADDPYVAFKQQSYTINIGKKINLTPQEKGTGKLTYTWSSSDETVATTDQKGNIAGVGEGATTISIVGTNKNGEEFKASCLMNVVVPITAIKSEEREVTICPYVEYTPMVLIEPENATMQELEWSSSKESVATVSEQGVIKGVNYGKCTITGKAKDGSNKTIKISVNVEQVSTKSIVIDTPDGAILDTCLGGGIIMTNYEGDCFETESIEGDVPFMVDRYLIKPIRAGKGAIVFQINFRQKIKVNITVKESALVTE